MNAVATAPIRIVVSDDDPSIREVLADIIGLQPAFELVGTACTGEEAIAVCLEQRPHVVVMDVRMPGTGGVGAVRKLRELQPSTRVLALSAYADRGAVTEMLTAGAVGYLVKGATAEQIVEALHKAARGMPSLSPVLAPAVVDALREHLALDHNAKEGQRRRLAAIRSVLDRERMNMVFQPIVELDSGRTVGFEALARFCDDPSRSPADWFADAEMVGLSVDLELMAIRLALQAFDELPPDTYLSVNVGPTSALSERLIPVLLSVAPERVYLEITEHAPIADYGQLVVALAPLRERGVRLAIDDAGSGFASLRHILSLSPDLIKLDISLTQGIDTDRSRRALASGLISFGESVGTCLLGEGVETAAELAALRELGVPFAQGYYLGRPGPLA
ncbi:MAG TPA: EAL domain-containing protein [Candidatus Angelobacter sp.]|nr:EAL domain-containing protein [Candidatus Angelobacter sp.]